jgi:transcriptional regulator with XRE-family HTH domain
MNLTQIRQQAGMTQAELAERLNISQVAVSRYEAGRAVPEHLLPPIAAVLNCDPDDLEGDTRTPRRKRVRGGSEQGGARWVQTLGHFAAKAKLTGEELSQRSNVPRARVAAMLRGELPVEGDEARALARVLNCEVADIRSGDPGTAVSGRAVFETHDMGGRPVSELTEEARDRALYELGMRNTPTATVPTVKQGRFTAGASAAAYRRALGWSQKELADRAGISQPAVSAIETGVAPLQRAVWKALASGFGVVPEALGTGEWLEAT